MTNLIEIVAQLQRDGYHVDVVIYNGSLLLTYRETSIDVTNMAFSDQIRYLVYLMNKEMFN